jgi:hypothetical protein
VERVNLKQLKDALNKLPDRNLEKFYAMHGMCFEEPEAKLCVVFFDDEEKWDEHLKLLKTPEAKVIKEFVEAVWDDAKKAMICIIDPDKVDDYIDDTP